MNQKNITCVGCGRRGKAGFFSVPKNPTVRKMWLRNCGVDPSIPIAPSARLCQKHFRKDDIIISNKQINLKKYAVPTIKVKPEKIRNYRSSYNATCIVCGRLNSENRSFFRIPFDSRIREQWLRNVGIKFADFNPIPKTVMRLCDSHFSETDFNVHPQSKTLRLRQGAMPLVKSPNTTPTATWSLEIDDVGDFDSSDRDIAFVSSCSSNKRCTISLNDDTEEEKLTESKISNVNISKNSSQDSKTVSVTSSRNGKKASDQSSISSSKKENVNPASIIDLTSEELAPEKNDKRIRRLREKKARLQKELTDHKSLLDDLLEKKLVTKEGRKMVKKFRRNSSNLEKL